jgi:hypothetical protein
MKFLKKLFSRKNLEQQTKSNESNESDYLPTSQKGVYIANYDSENEYQYSELSSVQKDHIEACTNILKDKFFASFLQFEHQPANHPINLDEYLSTWGDMGYDNFLDIHPSQHTAILAYNFGQYLVDTYGMKWKVKSEKVGKGEGVVVLLETPIKIELYPIDRTLRAVENKEIACFAEIEEKLKNAIASVK